MSTTSRFARSDGAWRRRARVLPGLLALLSFGSPAVAAGPSAAPIELDWKAPESCPSSQAVLSRIHKIVGKAVGAAHLKAEATVTERADRQLELQLVLRSGDLVSTRSIKGQSCSDLVGAIAVAMALLLNADEPGEAPARATPDGAGAADSAGKTTTTQPGSTSSADAPSPSPSSSAPSADDDDDDNDVVSSPRSWRGLLTLPMVAIGFGPEEEPSRGLGLAAGLGLARFRFYAEGKLWAARTATAQDDVYGARLERFTLTLRGCRAAWGVKFELAPCVLLSVQHLTARGTGPNIAPRTPAVAWLAPGLGLRARYLATPWLSLALAVDGEIQLSRPGIELQGVGAVERLSPFAATLSLGSEWIL